MAAGLGSWQQGWANLTSAGDAVYAVVPNELLSVNRYSVTCESADAQHTVERHWKWKGKGGL